MKETSFSKINIYIIPKFKWLGVSFFSTQMKGIEPLMTCAIHSLYHTKVFSIPASYRAGVHIPGSFQHASFPGVHTTVLMLDSVLTTALPTKAGYGFLPVQRVIWINCATTQTDLISMKKKTLLFKDQHLYYTKI